MQIESAYHAPRGEVSVHEPDSAGDIDSGQRVRASEILGVNDGYVQDDPDVGEGTPGGFQSHIRRFAGSREGSIWSSRSERVRLMTVNHVIFFLFFLFYISLTKLYRLSD